MNLIAENAAADAAITAEMPSAAAVTCTMMPQPIPATAATPPRRPSCVERATISAVSGPGVMFSSQPARMKNRRSCVPNMERALPG